MHFFIESSAKYLIVYADIFIYCTGKEENRNKHGELNAMKDKF